jgi:cytochrome c-type biogenesis protein CcmH
MSVLATVPLWIAVAVMIAIALLFVLPRLVSGKPPRARPSRAALNAAVYRSQIADLDSERASRALSQDDYERALGDIERRALDEAQSESPLVVRRSPRSAGAICVLLPVASIALYFVFGDPAALEDTRSPPRDAPEFRARLIDHLESHPRDGRGWVTLARIDMADDRFADAAASFEKALAVSAKIAGDADIWCELADALGMARGGALAGEPTAFIERALAVDARHPRALEMAGSAAYQRGDFHLAARFWNELRALVPADDQGELRAAIASAEQRARLSLPPPERPSIAKALP